MLLKSLALVSEVETLTLHLAACRLRRRTRRSVVTGDGEKAEMDVIESIVTDIVTAAEAVAAAVRDIGRGGPVAGIMKRNPGLDGTRPGTGAGPGAGAQAEMEIGTGDIDVLKTQHAVGAAVVTIEDVVAAGMGPGMRNIVAGLQRGGGAPALGIDGGAETAWIELAMS